MRSAKRKEALLAISITLPPHTLNLRSIFETIHEAVAHEFWGASGRDLPGGFRRPRARICQAIFLVESAASHEGFGILANVCGRD
jgi:hypothetical protein